jgi:hypothetical protein
LALCEKEMSNKSFGKIYPEHIWHPSGLVWTGWLHVKFFDITDFAEVLRKLDPAIKKATQNQYMLGFSARSTDETNVIEVYPNNYYHIGDMREYFFEEDYAGNYYLPLKEPIKTLLPAETPKDVSSIKLNTNYFLFVRKI